MGARFSAPVQTGHGAHPASCIMGTGSFPGVKSGRVVTLTAHPLLLLWPWMSRAIPLLPLWAVRPVQSLSACTRGALYTFHQICIHTRNILGSNFELRFFVVVLSHFNGTRYCLRWNRLSHRDSNWIYWIRLVLHYRRFGAVCRSHLEAVPKQRYPTTNLRRVRFQKSECLNYSTTKRQ